MLSVNGFTTNNLTTTGLYNIDADEINADTINCDTFLNQSSDLFTGVSSNIQTQINTINSLVSVGSTGGGYFSILATQNSGFIASSFWGYSSGTNPTVNNPLVFGYNFKLTSITFICQTTPTTSATVILYKNGLSVYTMSNVNSLSKTFSNINVEYLAGDTFNLFTQTGAGGTMVRATISCQVGGVTGATPQLSVGTVSNLASGSTPTVSISGTTLNPVLNFGLVTGASGINGTNGATGPQGPKGDTGTQGPQGQKGDKGDAGGVDPITAAAIAANTAGLATLAGTVAGITADVATLDTTVSGLTTSVGTLNEEVDALQGKTQFMTANTTTITTSFSSKLTTTDDITTSGKVTASSDISTATKVIATGDITTSAKLIATGDITTSAKVIATGDITTSAKVIATGDITTSAKVIATGDITTSAKVTATGDITTSAKVTATGDITTSAKVTATGDITTSGNISSNNCTLGGTLKASYIDGTTTGVTSVNIGHVNSIVDYTNVNINGTLYVNGIIYVPFNSVSSFLNQF
jgi:septum formation inhibitor MinC